MASPLILPVAAAIITAAVLHAIFLPEAIVTVVVCIICVCIHCATCARPASAACCVNTAFALSAAGAAGLSYAMAKGQSSNFGLFVAVVALYHCGEFFAVALSKPADVDNFGDQSAPLSFTQSVMLRAVVNHSAAYILAMICAAIEYWSVRDHSRDRITSCHPSPRHSNAGHFIFSFRTTNHRPAPYPCSDSPSPCCPMRFARARCCMFFSVHVCVLFPFTTPFLHLLHLPSNT